MLSVLRPGTFIFFGPQGPVPNEDRMRNIELLAEYVVPEIKAHADALGLASPFETKAGDVKLRTGEARSAVVDRAALPVSRNDVSKLRRCSISHRTTPTAPGGRAEVAFDLITTVTGQPVEWTVEAGRVRGQDPAEPFSAWAPRRHRRPRPRAGRR